MARAGLSPDVVVAAALDVVDADGLDALSLTGLAERLGVRTPSLYKHVDGLADLRERMAVVASRELAETLRDAAVGRSGPDAVAALMLAYRTFVIERPERYALVPVQPPEPGTDLADAADALVGVVVAALGGYDLHGDDAIHAARCLRSAVHGFATLEAAGGFGLPVAIDESYAQLVAMVTGGLDQMR